MAECPNCVLCYWYCILCWWHKNHEGDQVCCWLLHPSVKPCQFLQLGRACELCILMLTSLNVKGSGLGLKMSHPLATWQRIGGRRLGNEKLMKTLCKSLINPNLDFCSQLLSPEDEDWINSIEAVQIHSLFKVEGLKEMNYWEHLSHLHLHSQERLKEQYMVMFIWKISQGLVKGFNINFIESGGRGKMPICFFCSSCSAQSHRSLDDCGGVQGVKLFTRIC